MQNGILPACMAQLSTPSTSDARISVHEPPGQGRLPLGAASQTLLPNHMARGRIQEQMINCQVIYQQSVR